MAVTHQQVYYQNSPETSDGVASRELEPSTGVWTPFATPRI